MADIIGFYGQGNEYGCFSNFYPANFIVDGICYHWSEQYIMYQKAKLFGNQTCMSRILHATSPAVAKKIGRDVVPYFDDVWTANREALVVPGIYAKFKQNKDIRQILLDTGDAIIAECAPRDQIWGIGLGVGDPRVQDPNQWRGTNLLGQYLMKVRDMLRND